MLNRIQLFSCICYFRILDPSPLRVRLTCCTYTTTPFLEEEEEIGNNLEHASRTQGKPHAGRGQLLSVSTLFLSNLDVNSLRKGPSCLHYTALGTCEHLQQPQLLHRLTGEWQRHGGRGRGCSPLAPATPSDTGGRATPGDTGQDMSPGSAPMSTLPIICCRSSCLHGQPNSPSTGAPGGTWEPDKEKKTWSNLNFYDIKTANRVKGIGRTGPKINSTLQTANKAPQECKTVTCTVTNTITFQLKVISMCALCLET